MDTLQLTEAAFIASNPYLSRGQRSFEIDTLKEKMGDGVNRYLALPYLTLTRAEIERDLKNILTAPT